MVKPPLEVRSIRTGRMTIHTPSGRDVVTADFVPVARSARVMANAARAVVIGNASVDLRTINRALREPHQHAPELTGADSRGTTR